MSLPGTQWLGCHLDCSSEHKGQVACGLLEPGQTVSAVPNTLDFLHTSATKLLNYYLKL